MLHITLSKYDCIIVHKAYYLFTCTCVSINLFHSHSHSHVRLYEMQHESSLLIIVIVVFSINMTEYGWNMDVMAHYFKGNSNITDMKKICDLSCPERYQVLNTLYTDNIDNSS